MITDLNLFAQVVFCVSASLSCCRNRSFVLVVALDESLTEHGGDVNAASQSSALILSSVMKKKWLGPISFVKRLLKNERCPHLPALFFPKDV